MNRSGRLWLAILSAILAAATVSSGFPVLNEPVYQGRSLDDWLRDLDLPEAHDNAVEALRQMQPSPAPFLVERLRAQDNAGIDTAATLPAFSARGWHSAIEEQAGAMEGLVVLGPGAKSAIPDLARMISDPDPHLANTAIMILSRLGPESASVLVAALRNTPGPNFATTGRDRKIVESKRRRLVNAVGAMGTNAQAAVPIFLDDLKSRDSDICNAAIIALCQIDGRDRAIVLLVLDYLKSPDPLTRRDTARALGEAAGGTWMDFRQESIEPDFDPLAGAAALPPADPAAMAGLRGVVEHEARHNVWEEAIYSMIRLDPKGTLAGFVADLDSTNVGVRRNGALALGYFKKGARSAVPALIKGLSNKDAETRQDCAAALKEIADQPNIVVPALMRGLSDSDPKTQVADATALGAFGEAAKPAVPQIIEIYKKAANGWDGSAVFTALYNIDPGAAERVEQERARDTKP